MQTAWLIVGLGNPGSRYDQTWHNIGFAAVDELARRARTSFSSKFHAEIAHVDLHGQRVLLLKPQTFMNRSGLSVGEAARFYKIDVTQHLLIVADDLDLAQGRLRLRLFGGTGGHNGLKSIHESLGSEKYPRLRVGIGRSDQLDPATYVLAKVIGKQRDQFEQTARVAADAVEECLKSGVALAMNSVNQRKEPS